MDLICRLIERFQFDPTTLWSMRHGKRISER
jgi:hypothetical protein